MPAIDVFFFFFFCAFLPGWFQLLVIRLAPIPRFHVVQISSFLFLLFAATKKRTCASGKPLAAPHFSLYWPFLDGTGYGISAVRQRTSPCLKLSWGKKWNFARTPKFTGIEGRSPGQRPPAKKYQKTRRDGMPYLKIKVALGPLTSRLNGGFTPS